MFNDTFYGQKISEYGKENGFVDYAALARSFNAVLNNNIMEKTNYENWTLENGAIEYYEDGDGNIIGEDEYWELDDEEQEKYEEHYYDVFQYYIIDDNGAEILKKETHELVWYNEELDMYVWGVTHWGTSWDYVLTEIPCEKNL